MHISNQNKRFCVNRLFIMRLISFDVGIKNLAYCVFSFDTDIQSNPNANAWYIPEWNCTNLLTLDAPETTSKSCVHLIKDKRTTTSKKKREEQHETTHLCNKTAKWIVPNDSAISYCEVHAKMQNEWIIPKKRQSSSHINKLKLVELETEYADIFAKSDKLQTKKMKKSELIERIVSYYESKCFRSTMENVAKSKNAGETDLITIGRAIRRQLDEDPSTYAITHVIIENQISTIATRMKTIQGMIAQYFIMRFGDSVNIEFVSSHNKLKGFIESRGQDKEQTDVAAKTTTDVAAKTTTDVAAKTTTSYKANKSDGIAICRRFMESNIEMNGWSVGFEKSKKRDDLADCFLQGIWYLKSNKIISYADNLKINIVSIS
jgi:hypothetical protein